MALWQRQVIVRIGPPGGTGREFTQLRTTFDITMTRESTPNEGTIEVYNVAPDSAALIQDANNVVELLVGYDVPRLIFRGNPVKDGVRVETRGADRVLHIEAQDGARAYESGRVSVSFSQEVTLAQVFDEVASQLGLPTGTIRTDSSMRFVNGVTICGQARDVLDQLALSNGSNWLVRDGVLSFVGAGEDTGEQAVVFSASTGNLVGSPTVKDGALTIKALIEPSMRPGKAFRVVSRDTNGDYTASEVKFAGDSTQGEFYVTVTGDPR